jgi:cobalamin biosynthesis Mg chelatase CobN
MRHLSFALLATLALVASVHVSAATLVAIVSERNAADVAQAARIFHERYPEHRLIFRTTAQADALSDAQLQVLTRDADAILLATVFKETAQRFSAALATARAPEVLAVAGDPALGRLSRWQGERLFTDADARYDELSSLTAEKDASAAAVAKAVAAYPKLAPWIRARGYWQNRGEDNLVSLFALLLSRTDERLAAAATPIEDALPLRFRYGGRWLAPDELNPCRTS